MSLFISNLHEQIEAGKVQDAEGAAVARMLDEAGLGRLKVGAGGRSRTCTATRAR